MNIETQPTKTMSGINEIGFSILYDSEDAIVDIVFVHGLQGHPRKTWACEKKSETEQHEGKATGRRSSSRRFKKLFSPKRSEVSKNMHLREPDEVFWPQDLLPKDCVNSGILTWGYDSKVSHFFGGPTNQSNIFAHARNLLHALKVRRLKHPGRNFIFIAHSLGGIIVKEVLNRAAEDLDPAILEIYTSTEAIIFLGTPHRGSSKAGIAEVVRKIVSVSGFDTSDQNIRALQVNGAEFELVHERFMKLYEQKNRLFKALTFQEAKGVIGISYLKLNERVVEPFSSSITTTEPIQTINANHMSMCRFTDKEDEGYKQILSEIQILVSKLQKNRDEAILEKDKELANLIARPPSQATVSSSSTYSMNDTDRKCIILLTQNTSNVAEYKSSLPSRVEGTCRWILSDPQYRQWSLQNESCVLWLSGCPGSGKTILSAYILEYVGAGEISPAISTTECYFFCDEKINTQRDAMAILRSLIHQLLIRRRLLIKYVKAVYDVQGPQFEHNLDELWKIFVTIASDKRVGPVSVIIDAIDECEESTRDRLLQNVIRFISNSQSPNSTTPCIKFLVTSRPLIGRHYTNNLLEIDSSQNYLEQDLRLVIQTKVESIARRTRCKPEVRIYLESVLNSRADGTFLWVTLVLHLLEKSFLASQKDFKRIIDELPMSLTATYERFLYRIPPHYQHLATKLLHFLVGSSRPLTLDEMRILLAMQDHHRTLAAIEEDAQPNIQETIEGVLGPLIRIRNSRIYLVHQSLKEFLQALSTQTDNPLSPMYGIDPCRASLLLAEGCASYLLLDNFRVDLFSQAEANIEYSPTSPVARFMDEDSSFHLLDMFDLRDDIIFKDPSAFETEACESIQNRYPFYEYSARHWARHFSSASSISTPQLRQDALLLSDTSSIQGLNWFRFYWHHAEMSVCPRDFVAIVTSSYFGHIPSLETLLLKGLPLESKIGSRAIYWASRMGHCEAVNLLLQGNVNPDAKVVDNQSSFIAAVQNNRLDVAKLLLEGDGLLSEEEGYRVNCTRADGRSALSIAAGNGFVELVEQLLQHKRIEPDTPDFKSWTPLFWSVNAKTLKVFHMLIADNRVSVNHIDRYGRNVLSWAASAGALELVKCLMDLEGLQAHEPDMNGRTALSWAAGNGHLETTMYLRRSQRFDVSRKDNDGRNAISWACSGAHDKVIEYLIKHDREGVDGIDVDEWTPLAWALFKEAPKTMQVLLDSGLVDVNKKDTNGRTVLSFASGYGYHVVVQQLLKVEGIETDTEDNSGRTPLSYAARYPEIVKALLGVSR